MKRLLGFLSHRRNWLGVSMLVVLAGVALATPFVAPHQDQADSQYFMRVGRITDTNPHPPGETALLGTLSGQFDGLYTLLWGLRQAFQFGISVTLVTGTFGMLYGAVSAYLGGKVNNVMMRICDAFLTFPILAAIVFMRQIRSIMLLNTGAALPFIGNDWFFPDGISQLQQFLVKTDPVMLSLLLLSWMPYARLVNASILRLRTADYITSARALGAGHARIILRHLLPNAISPQIVLAARDVGGMVILQATFSFIGLGGNSAWGQLLARSRDWIVGPGGNPLVYWWTYLPVTIALILFSVSWNFVGDSLNDWLNPHKLA
jgi:peptide/nickel transport system permease protein